MSIVGDARSRATVVVSVLLLLCASLSVLAAPDVQLPSGTVRGFDKQASESFKPYSVYYGIPYAEPPVGELRFLPPCPFVGRGPGAVITSDNFREVCFQPAIAEQRMSEDCLHLNVFSPPDEDFGPPRKVMVWIHGGGFSGGETGPYVPSRMVTDNDVIVVTIQYRLGALGFLSSGDGALPGNLGLHDQVQALQWVKDNIGRFGGDANDVTIFGQSAGSASVAALCLTPATKGLFTKAILQSGAIPSSWSLINNPQKQFYTHAKNTGCFPRTYNPWNRRGYHDSIVACMKRKSAVEILEAQEEFAYPDMLRKSLEELSLFGPVTDGNFFPRAPPSLLSDRAYLQQIGALDRSYIMGVTDNEALLLVASTPRESWGNFTDPSNVASLLKSNVQAYTNWSPDEDTLNVVDFVYTFPRETDGRIPLQKVLDVTNDMSYIVPMMRFARALVTASASTPVYLYVFDAEPRLKEPNGLLQGTTHGLDIYCLFDMPSNYPIVEQLLFFYADYDPIKFPIMAEAFKDLVTSFAKTGIPRFNGLRAWPRFDMSRESYVSLSTSPEVRERMFAQRMALWTDLFPRMTASSWFGAGRGRAAFRG